MVCSCAFGNRCPTQCHYRRACMNHDVMRTGMHSVRRAYLYWLSHMMYMYSSAYMHSAACFEVTLGCSMLP